MQLLEVKYYNDKVKVMKNKKAKNLPFNSSPSKFPFLFFILVYRETEMSYVSIQDFSRT